MQFYAFLSVYSFRFPLFGFGVFFSPWLVFCFGMSWVDLLLLCPRSWNCSMNITVFFFVSSWGGGVDGCWGLRRRYVYLLLIPGAINFRHTLRRAGELFSSSWIRLAYCCSGSCFRSCFLFLLLSWFILFSVFGPVFFSFFLFALDRYCSSLCRFLSLLSAHKNRSRYMYPNIKSQSGDAMPGPKQINYRLLCRYASCPSSTAANASCFGFTRYTFASLLLLRAAYLYYVCHAASWKFKYRDDFFLSWMSCPFLNSRRKPNWTEWRDLCRRYRSTSRLPLRLPNMRALPEEARKIRPSACR